MSAFVHPLAVCESVQIGCGTRIWEYVHVLPGAVIGEDANVCAFTFIENDVVLGNRVTVKSHVALWDGLSIGDDVFIGPGVCFSNDKYPRSRRRVPAERTMIANGASLGAGAVILPGVKIGSHAMIAAGSIVTRDVPPFTLVKGNPARASGLVCRCGAPLENTGALLRCTQGDWTGVMPSEDMACSRW